MPKPSVNPGHLGPKNLAKHLKDAGFWRRLTSGSAAYRVAARYLEELLETNHDLMIRLAKNERAFNETRRKLEAEVKLVSKDLFKRTNTALEELERSKKNGRKEVAVAVILSPAQYSELTSHGYFRQSRLAKLEIYVARGVYGPVVLTQDAFNGFSRMAPELDIRAMRPSYENDKW